MTDIKLERIFMNKLNYLRDMIGCDGWRRVSKYTAIPLPSEFGRWCYIDHIDKASNNLLIITLVTKNSDDESKWKYDKYIIEDTTFKPEYIDKLLKETWVEINDHLFDNIR